MNKLYMATPDGYCGDEDNGQTSAWYIFSAMGFYPVTPASDQYVIGSPLFKKIVVQLENGQKLTINAPENNPVNRYVNKISINGNIYPKNWFSHKELVLGASIRFSMSPVPNKQRGTSDADVPYSFSREK